MWCYYLPFIIKNNRKPYNKIRYYKFTQPARNYTKGNLSLVWTDTSLFIPYSSNNTLNTTNNNLIVDMVSLNAVDPECVPQNREAARLGLCKPPCSYGDSCDDHVTCKCPSPTTFTPEWWPDHDVKQIHNPTYGTCYHTRAYLWKNKQGLNCPCTPGTTPSSKNSDCSGGENMQCIGSKVSGKHYCINIDEPSLCFPPGSGNGYSAPGCPCNNDDDCPNCNGAVDGEFSCENLPNGP